jgi:hypothetical protein
MPFVAPEAASATGVTALPTMDSGTLRLLSPEVAMISATNTTTAMIVMRTGRFLNKGCSAKASLAKIFNKGLLKH